MQIARYLADGAPRYGLVEDQGFRRLAAEPFMRIEPTGRIDPFSQSRLLCPVDKPRIFGAGLNYSSHIAETGKPMPRVPMLFMKPDTAAAGPGDHVVYPREGREVHYEGELAVVVGKEARRVAEEDALDVVLGYTCANDFSERTIQREEMALGCLLIGKAFDGFCPLGPYIATGLDPTNLDMEVLLNGERRQSINTSDLLFGVAQLVSWISQAITLRPTDVIITGTPSGVGPVAPGDIVDVTISGIGTLTNRVVAED